MSTAYSSASSLAVGGDAPGRAQVFALKDAELDIRVADIDC